jgi:excisionase family DNA binding protein
VSSIMSIADASKFLGVSVHSVRHLARNGQLPAAKIGRCWRFYKEDLESFIRSQYKTYVQEPKAQEDRGPELTSSQENGGSYGQSHHNHF